jgi:hypothetical protein
MVERFYATPARPSVPNEECVLASDYDALAADRERLRDLLAECYEYIDADSSEQPPFMAKIREALGVGDGAADSATEVQK